MEMRDLIQFGLDRVKEATMKSLDGLSRSEIVWRPGPGANSIGLIIFHALRYEDIFVQAHIQGKAQLWESGKWYEKWKLPAGDTGSGYTAEQVAAFPVPELKDLLAYAEAVRAGTVDFLKRTGDDGFGKTINVPRRGDVTVGWYLMRLIVHIAQHSGEIGYLRGLQRGMDK